MTKVKLNINNIKLKLKVKRKMESNKIKYSNFISKLKYKFNLNPIKIDTKVIMDEKIQYEDFLKIIISRNLNNLCVKDWKHLVNNVEQFDNTYPLFWACEHACLEEAKMLIKNGSEFKPKYDGIIKDESSVKKDCFEIILTMISSDYYYDSICYRKFRNKPLNNYNTKLFNDFDNYRLILELLMNNYTSILGINYFDYDKLKKILTSNSTDIIKYFFEKINLYQIDLKLILFELFNDILRIYAQEIIDIKGFEKDIICYKEFKRIKIIFIVKLVSKFFINCGIKDYNFHNKRVEKYFGTFNKSNLNSTRLFSEKLNYFRNIDSEDFQKPLDFEMDWYKDISKLFDNLIKKYERELESFMIEKKN